MKLLYITRGFPPGRGGTENYIWEIYKRLAGRNKIEVITYFHKDRREKRGVHEVRRLKGSRNFPEFVNFMSSVAKISMKLDFDLIHAVTYPNGVSALLPKITKGRPLVVTIHDIGYIERGVENVSTPVKAVKGFLQEMVCNAADAIIVPSGKVKKDIMKYHGIRSGKIFITPYGIDTKSLNPRVKRGVMRSKWGLKNDPIVLFIGMYSPKKGIEYLIRAVSEAKREIPGIKLVIAGPSLDANYEREIRNLVDSIGLGNDVIFTGYFEERLKPNVYKDADIVVEPTLYGMGYSFACVEASAMGKPVIATKLIEEIDVVKDGVTGIVVPFRDSHAISKGIVRILKSKKLYEKLSIGGRNFAGKLSWDECARLTENVYRKVIGIEE